MITVQSIDVIRKAQHSAKYTEWMYNRSYVPQLQIVYRRYQIKVRTNESTDYMAQRVGCALIEIIHLLLSAFVAHLRPLWITMDSNSKRTPISELWRFPISERLPSGRVIHSETGQYFPVSWKDRTQNF